VSSATKFDGIDVDVLRDVGVLLEEPVEVAHPRRCQGLAGEPERAIVAGIA